MTCPWRAGEDGTQQSPLATYRLPLLAKAADRTLVYFNEHGIAPAFSAWISKFLNAMEEHTAG
eukprot:CAMPEP_0177685248 /NCGR_PEP_ID=MMETSP0447-20121125/32916_1 /TAXON_ID=0 /ORGANISM="Stygamoeba regulata, Strain BSH-02190019" /LENGTH=62 /DNA_ID=CAMNT_0019195255 /DNA_START=76 /DNA_END=260 /DNA_ORIENTATION=-